MSLVSWNDYLHWFENIGKQFPVTNFFLILILCQNCTCNRSYCSLLVQLPVFLSLINSIRYERKQICWTEANSIWIAMVTQTRRNEASLNQEAFRVCIWRNLKKISNQESTLFCVQNSLLYLHAWLVFFMFVRCGYATLHNVMDKTKEDRMESFFLSETCKYLYLVS